MWSNAGLWLEEVTQQPNNVSALTLLKYMIAQYCVFIRKVHSLHINLYYHNMVFLHINWLYHKMVFLLGNTNFNFKNLTNYSYFQKTETIPVSWHETENRVVGAFHQVLSSHWFRVESELTSHKSIISQYGISIKKRHSLHINLWYHNMVFLLRKYTHFN